MADLRELHAALASLEASGKTAKVSYLLHPGRRPEDAFRFDFGRRRGALPRQPSGPRGGRGAGGDCRTESRQGRDVAGSVGRRFRRLGADRSRAGPSRPGKACCRRHLRPGRPRRPRRRPITSRATVAAARSPHVFYSHLSMQRDVLDLLQPLFGVGAQKKIEEFAQVSPPINHPADFLDKCRQHAAMMLGPRKAEELFKPIFEKLSLSQ